MATSEGRPNKEDLPLSETIIIMQGWLEKQSSHLKKWRKRWTVILKRETEYFIETYKNAKNSNNATALINITKSTDIKEKTFSENISGFVIDTHKRHKSVVTLTPSKNG